LPALKRRQDLDGASSYWQETLGNRFYIDAIIA
jgi:hypothetical protein